MDTGAALYEKSMSRQHQKMRKPYRKSKAPLRKSNSNSLINGPEKLHVQSDAGRRNRNGQRSVVRGQLIKKTKSRGLGKISGQKLEASQWRSKKMERW